MSSIVVNLKRKKSVESMCGKTLVSEKSFSWCFLSYLVRRRTKFVEKRNICRKINVIHGKLRTKFDYWFVDHTSISVNLQTMCGKKKMYRKTAKIIFPIVIRLFHLGPSWFMSLWMNLLYRKFTEKIIWELKRYKISTHKKKLFRVYFSFFPANKVIVSGQSGSFSLLFRMVTIEKL